MMDEPVVADYMVLVERIVSASENLSPLGAGILAALVLDIAADSRTFARVFGIAHAIALREISLLSVEGGFIAITRRDLRTQRSHYELAAVGRYLLDTVGTSKTPS
ncbi:hypothetical protein AAIB41_06820 [Brucella sp. BE17]|uniref:hypothetical protein n=1 Tax=Brucella sp. BE17 TaxID=3142977 RepID=UPI0031BBB501